MSEEAFQRYSAYYDLLYRDKDYGAEASYVAQRLRAANPNATSVLEFGSGTGRHGRLLCAQGFDVVGIERSEWMRKAAQICLPNVDQNGGSFQSIQGDIRSAEIGQTFDAVLALFHVISYQTTDEEVIRTFANAAAHLRSEGIFFFDVWHGPAVLHERPTVREKRVEDERTCLTRIATPELDLDANTVTVRYSMLAESKIDQGLTKFSEEHRMRYFFPFEIDAFANETGFNVECSEEFLTGQVPSNHTWGVAYLLRKRRA